MKTIHDIPHLEGVKVIVRADFNVPIQNGAVVDDFRIRMAVSTLDFLQERGARLIVISHLEASDGTNLSLEPIAVRMRQLGKVVKFVPDLEEAFAKSEKMENGEIILLENIRMYEQEKKNDRKFAKELASLGDIFVNEAFPVSHREHASIVGIPQYLPSFAGLQLAKEVENLSKAFSPTHPFLFILNGAKFETKLPLVEKFISTVDNIFIGGALSSDFFRAKGYELGKSLVSNGNINLTKYMNDPKLLLPVDVKDQLRQIYSPDSFNKEAKIVDVGPKTMDLLREKVMSSKFILWNGPLGVYEQGFNETTEELAKYIAEATENGAVSIVGGGDTIAAIEKMKIGDKFTFMSSGGGAMLDFLAKGTLPGIEALNQKE